MADVTYQNLDQTKSPKGRFVLSQLLVNFFKRIQSYREKTRAVIELRKLDNRMLKDIGVDRSEIVYRVWQHKQD